MGVVDVRKKQVHTLRKSLAFPLRSVEKNTFLCFKFLGMYGLIFFHSLLYCFKPPITRCGHKVYEGFSSVCVFSFYTTRNILCIFLGTLAFNDIFRKYFLCHQIFLQNIKLLQNLLMYRYHI